MMPPIKKQFIGIIFSLLFAVGSFYIYTTSSSREGVVQGFSLASPLPNLLAHAFLPQEHHNFWRPTGTVTISTLPKPIINSSAALSYDISTDKLLYAYNMKKHLPIASLTKIMTAIVALESASSDSSVSISKQAATVGEDSMGLETGEILTLKELLYGLFLHSGNDAAEAIADSSKYGRDNFVYLMNKKAENIGLSDTHFTNPTGLEGDGNQYSTAYDLLVMTRYGLQDPIFSEVASTVQYVIPYTSHHKAFDLFNETNLLTSYPGVKGVKTGFTNEAGMCLVTYLEYDGHKIIGILLNSSNRRQEMKDLLDYSLKVQSVKPPDHS